MLGIDEVRDEFFDSVQDPWLREEPSPRFLVSWCTAMSRLIEEYGAVLARRPWEIYLIVLCPILTADPTLGKLWQKCGESPRREMDLQWIAYRVPRPPQE